MKFTKSSFGLASWAGVLGLLLGLCAATVRAEEGLLPPQVVIQKTADQLQVSLQKPEYKSDFRKATALVDQIIEPQIDFDRVSVLILGKLWKTATPEQKDRFKKEFRLLLVRTYTTAFTEYADWKIRYLPLEMNPADKKVMVRTEILQSGAQPVGVNYRMILEGSQWKVYDVLIEGVSLLQNYRSSFTDEVARTGSLDQLITHLTERNAAALKEPVGKKGS
ncbi:phospholipid transport system substrate-binding protein [Methylomagnum ishizawai]|uniref:Phospholipid transport system substrate-binding protein n=1 Tax=Methylomagnum ishizawai TaxID=1760988 RepID=A0A1Y6CTM9_9GAMM|nr:ABC transporter substrate-binding protein [Methylomagnum ishizawai]SMF93656.1 phospholipid transport system substrate-binding protein [Methylomagnum ishizawai]